VCSSDLGEDLVLALGLAGRDECGDQRGVLVKGDPERVEGNQAADGRPQKGGAIPRAAAIDLGCPFRNPAARNEDIDGVRGSLRAGRVEKRAAVWVDAESGAEGTAPAE